MKLSGHCPKCHQIITPERVETGYKIPAHGPKRACPTAGHIFVLESETPPDYVARAKAELAHQAQPVSPPVRHELERTRATGAVLAASMLALWGGGGGGGFRELREPRQRSGRRFPVPQ